MVPQSDIDYVLENDNELTHLALQDHIIKHAMLGELVRALISFSNDSPLHVLESCTMQSKLSVPIRSTVVTLLPAKTTLLPSGMANFPEFLSKMIQVGL